MHISNTDMHVICISETWLTKWHTNKRAALQGYKLIRADRCDERRDGGVAMYVRNDLKMQSVSEINQTTAL
jgi:hypothetical protein